MKKAYFIDLDNTVYFTRPHVEVLLGPLYNLLANEDLGISAEAFEKAKLEMMRTPFQKVAKLYQFNEAAIANAVAYLEQDEVKIPLKVHDEYHYLKALTGLKFIVTAGFEKKQRSKVKMLGIAEDFDEVFVVDATKTTGNKKDAFIEVMQKYKLHPSDVLVIGDDADSEIKFGLELGVDTFLYDPNNNFPDAPTTYRSTTLKDISLIA
ncbi:HAD family hydrolase [Pedobacter sp. KR3-3]|uniref:HAD family hydrolase n=1 Tax=Pedobacter albus TaxID=3113905 RepID=A0ABU7I9Y8_9SPHI|nr:HAD family hydrolase [Pedobacter sp. KR3-3]MEE1946308.1 HAD family hydrolase [Pedobacter sp. KR3-3]